MAAHRPLLHQLSCSNETVQNAPKYEFFVQWRGSAAFGVKNSDVTFDASDVLINFVYRTCALMAPLRPVLPQLSRSNEAVQNAPQHEFWV
jgi:hypothetical protein